MHDPAGAAVDRDRVALGELLPADRRACAASTSIVSSSQPATQGLPIPRATTAACEVMPPCAVRIPAAWIRPWMSSGVVSQRTRITLSPALPRSSAVSASSTTAPQAAPGEAFRPRAATSSSAVGSIIGCSSWSSCAGSIRATASSREISPSSTIVDGGLQRGGRRALGRARLQQVEPALLDRELDVLHVAVVLLEPAHRVGQLRRTPPAAARSIAAERLRRADAGDDVLALRVGEELAVEAAARRWTGRGVKQTPVPEPSPLLPKTISTTLTAVPRSSGIPCARR